MVAAAAMVWGTWSLFLRPAEAIAPISPFTETLVVQIAASCVALPMAWRYRRRGRSWGQWLTLGLAGVSDTGSGALFFFAMSMTSLALATLTHYLAPVLVAVVAPVLERRRHTPATLLATAASLLGLALMLEPWHQAMTSRSYLGATAGAVSAVFYACIVLLSKRVGSRFASFEMLATQRVTAVLVMFPVGWHEALQLQGRQVVSLLAGGAIINGLAGMLFFAGLQRCRAEQAAALTLLEPVVAVLMGWVVWHERLGAGAMVGVGMMLVSLYVVLTQKVPQEST